MVGGGKKKERKKEKRNYHISQIPQRRRHHPLSAYQRDPLLPHILRLVCAPAFSSARDPVLHLPHHGPNIDAAARMRRKLDAVTHTVWDGAFGEGCEGWAVLEGGEIRKCEDGLETHVCSLGERGA